MTFREIARLRLASQLISPSVATSAAHVVTQLGAIQAQDYLASLWAVGVRIAGATEADIENAVAARSLVRTWPLRGTLHLVAPADVRWMLALLSPRIVAASAGRQRQLALDAQVLARSEKLLIRALQGGRRLTRDAAYGVLEAARIATDGQRGYHIFWHLAQRGVLCGGPRDGKQPTFVLLDEWIPATPPRNRDTSLGELARRYFTGHGPATVRDFAWWSGLTLADARAGLASGTAELEKIQAGGETYWLSPGRVPPPASRTAHLLPAFDEYFLGYQDRGVSVAARHVDKIFPGANGLFLPIVVLDGRIIGTWKRTLRGKSAEITTSPFVTLNQAERRAVAAATDRYRAFLNLRTAPTAR